VRNSQRKRFAAEEFLRLREDCVFFAQKFPLDDQTREWSSNITTESQKTMYLNRTDSMQNFCASPSPSISYIVNPNQNIKPQEIHMVNEAFSL
jgi:hypothetical protein